MARAELERLAEALEAAAGPSRELDAIVGLTLDNMPVRKDAAGVPVFDPAPYTASIDAAVALIERFPQFDSSVLLAESFAFIWQDGWPKTPPLGPILARAACLRLVRALITQEGADHDH